LLIVIVIMGVVYHLAINSLETIKKLQNNEKLRFSTLKRFLLHFSFEKSSRLVCLQGGRCFVVLDNEKAENIEDDLDTNGVVLYRYTPREGLIETECEPYFNTRGIEQDVRFSYTITKDGIGEQLIVQTDKGVYDYTSYLDDVVEYNTPEELVSAKEGLLFKAIE